MYGTVLYGTIPYSRTNKHNITEQSGRWQSDKCVRTYDSTYLLILWVRTYLHVNIHISVEGIKYYINVPGTGTYLQTFVDFITGEYAWICPWKGSANLTSSKFQYGKRHVHTIFCTESRFNWFILNLHITELRGHRD